MKVLIIGGEGFVGKAIQQKLSDDGVEYLSVSRSTEIAVDISNYTDFGKIRKEYYDVVVNCATVLPGGDYLDNGYLDKIYRTNMVGSQNICKWVTAQEKQIRVINCSTLVVNNKPWPLNLGENNIEIPVGRHVLYSSSKLFQESLFKTMEIINNTEVVQLRFSAIYGEGMPWNGILCTLIDRAKNNEPIELMNGDNVSFDFINVTDVASIICDFAINSATGTFNAASGNEIFLYDLAKMIVKITGSTSQVKNFNANDFEEDRADIDVSKLSAYFPQHKFVSLETGIKNLFS